MPVQIRIGDKGIGTDYPCYVIAEAGVNHNGELDLARRLVDVAADAGADAVKFQTFHAKDLVSDDAPLAEYQRRGVAQANSQLEMLRALELSESEHLDLQAHCKMRGIEFLSTPFDYRSADLLDTLGVPLFKIGSGEVTNFPFLEYVAGKGKPIVLSTGMSTLGEVDEAVRTLECAGCSAIVILHCVSNYPADPADVNLSAMQTMAHAWRWPIGYSDHTIGNELALAAIALGARVIEKHFTLDCSLAGPDHAASAEPQELKALVEGIRTIESAIGSGRKEPSANELATACVVRRSLVAARDIAVGQVIGREDLAILRPGTGLPPRFLSVVVGRVARRQIAKEALIDLGMLE